MWQPSAHTGAEPWAGDMLYPARWRTSAQRSAAFLEPGPGVPRPLPRQRELLWLAFAVVVISLFLR